MPEKLEPVMIESQVSSLDRKRALRSAAGRAGGMLEQLENRVLLAGEPGLGDFPTAINMTPIGGGEFTGAGDIESIGNDDLFSFTVTTTDFVTILADALNAGSGLDTRIELYKDSVLMPGTPMPVTDADLNVLASNNNGDLSTNPDPTDAWIGAVLAPNTYFVRVLGENGTTGTYTLRVDTTTDLITNNATSRLTQAGTISMRGDDIVYQFTTGSGDALDTLATFNARVPDPSDPDRLDTHLEIYDKDGRQIGTDQEFGLATNAFVALRSSPDTTYYVRVRSDDYLAGQTTATGDFSLVIDVTSTNAPIDPVTRIWQSGGFNLASGDDTLTFDFVAQGDGRSFIELTPVGGFNPLLDGRIQFFRPDGTRLTVDDGASFPQVRTFLEGGERYFVVVDNFDDVTGGGDFGMVIEAHHTLDNTVPIDDHVGAPDFANATPIRFDFAGATSTDPFFLPAPPTPPPLLQFDHVGVWNGWSTGRIDNGSDTDLFVFVPPVDMLGEFEGKPDISVMDEPQPWLANRRPASRVEIQLSSLSRFVAPDLTPSGTDTLFDTADYGLRVYDSTGAVVYGPNTARFNFTLPFTSDVGSIDPSRWPTGFDLARDGIDFNAGVLTLEVWGGEPYYIEVFENTGIGGGRYDLEVIVDAIADPSLASAYTDVAPTDAPEWLADTISSIFENGNAGDPSIPNTGFDEATEIGIFTLSGSNTTFETADNFFDLDTEYTRIFALDTVFERPDQGNTEIFFLGDLLPFDQSVGFVDPGVAIFQEGGLAGIQHPNDTDLFFFVAPFTGSAEIRVQTTGLNDTFSEVIVDGDDDFMEPEVSTEAKAKTYNSIFDSALRIFNADLEQIGYNNDNTALDGTTDIQSVGTQGTFTFNQRDARVVFDVRAGERYFIQVESGQKAAFDAYMAGDASVPVDWAGLYGSYDLLIHATPSARTDGFVDGDDFSDVDNNLGTVWGTTTLATTLPIDDNGDSIISGEILSSPVNAIDSDVFSFIAPVTAEITITLTQAPGSSLQPEFVLFEGLTNPLAQVGGLTSASTTIDVQQGQRYYINAHAIDGLTEGGYTLTISGLGVFDDHVNAGDWVNATTIELNNLLGTGTATGTLETLGDTDIFFFTHTDFDTFEINVSSPSGSLDPAVDIYELTIDPANGTVLQRIATNDDLALGVTTSQVRFAVTPDRVQSGATPRFPALLGVDLSGYYVVVRSNNAVAGTGDYLIDVTFEPTDDHPDDGEFGLVVASPIDLFTGLATLNGEIEIPGDSDVFSYIAPASGPARIDVRQIDGVLPQIRIVAADQTTVLASTDSGGATGTVAFAAERGELYYVIVEASASAGVGTDVGTYAVDISTPPVDDHPNEGEFDLATLIILDPTTGDAALGALSPFPVVGPMITPPLDTDLFRFTTIEDGDVTITIDASPTGLGTQIAPMVRVFNSAEVEIASSSTATIGGMVTVTITGALAGEEYFFLVQDTSGTRSGEYAVGIDGPEPSMGGGPGGVDFGNVSVVNTANRTGDGVRTGAIDIPGDRDLFSFTVPDPGDRTRLTRVFVQVRTPDGSLLDAQITVLDQPNELPTSVIAQDSFGIPGASASAEFDAMPGQTFFVIVSGANMLTTGDYTIHVDTEPETFFLYYPEGFASAAISEFLAIGNANDYDVRYTIRVNYAISGGQATIVTDKLIRAGSRGGVTLSDGQGGFFPGIIPDDPYSVVIESNGPLAATSARYDFDSSAGDSFTERTSDTWTFARVERNPGSVFDFVLYHNPNPFDINVTLTVTLDDGSTVDITRPVEANRRGGLAIDPQVSLPIGVFGATVTAAPADPVNNNDFIGIVAAISHFNSAEQSGFGLLGDPDAGATRGAITSLQRGNGVDAELVLYNPSSTNASVTLTGKYIRNNFADLVRNFTLDPGETLRLTGAQLGLISGQPAGIEFSSNVPVSIVTSETQLGEANASGAANQAAQSWFFGDAFINSLLAGDQYFETLSFYNPASVSTTVEVRLLFTNSDIVTISIDLDARGFGELVLHEASEILSRPDPLNFFSIDVAAPTPIVASLVHYDLFLRGGWGNTGGNFGLLNPIEGII